MLIRVFLTTILALCLFLPMSAEAKRPPECGDISRNDIKNTYEAARDVRYYFGVDDKIENICQKMEDFQDWYKDLPTDFRRDKDFDKARDRLIKDTEKHIKDLRRPLRILYALINAKTENTAERLLKEVQIRERREDVDDGLATLNSDLEKIKTFMEKQNVKLEEYEKNPPAKWWEPKQ